jgi:hypothetical protein
MSNRRYTEAEKDYMTDQAIKAVLDLDGDYPSFKNYIWSVQHVLNGGTLNNNLDITIRQKLNQRGLLK